MLTRFYSNPLPNLNEYVVVSVKELNENTIVKVELLEYGGIIGIIFQKQLITQKKETITQALSKLGRQFVLQVSKINISNGSIDLDKLQVTEDIEKKTLKRFADNKAVQSFVQSIVHKFKRDEWDALQDTEERKKLIEDTYREIIWDPLEVLKKELLDSQQYKEEDIETYLAILIIIVQDESLLAKYLTLLTKYEYYNQEELSELILKRFQQPRQNYTMPIEIVSTYSVLGVIAIKNAAKEAFKVTEGWQYAEDEQALKLTIITPPKYAISIILKNPKVAEQRIQDFYKALETGLKVYGATVKKDKLQSQIIKDAAKKASEQK